MLTTKQLAKRKGISEHAAMELVRLHKGKLDRMGRKVQHREETVQTAGGPQKKTYAVLNEQQMHFLSGRHQGPGNKD